MDNIELAGFSMHQQDREATSGNTRGGDMCIFVNNSWCTMSNIIEVSRYCSPEAEYLMISCRPPYLPIEFTSILFIAVYLPPKTDAGTKTALNQLYKAISKQENAHPDAALLVQANLNLFLSHFYQDVTCATRGKITPDHLYSTHRDTYKALPHPPFGKSEHNSMLLIPAYKQKSKQEVPVTC
jgi:hypothetical protein